MPHPAVLALKKHAQSIDAHLVVMPQQQGLTAMSLREITIRSGEHDLQCIVSDEYGDADLNCKAISLHLLLKTCEYFEDAVNFSEWRNDMELPDDSFSAKFYQDLAALVPKLRDIFGSEIRSISDYDIQFNTTIAKELRLLSE